MPLSVKLWRDRSDERGVSLTTEVLVFIPLAVTFFAFLTNAILHWVGLQYVQYETAMAARYTSAALGDNPLPYIPGAGSEMTPSQYLTQKLESFWLVSNIDSTGATNPPSAVCEMVSKTDIANGLSRCVAKYQTIVIPPVPPRVFGQRLATVSESLTETGSNPNVQ